MIYVKEESKNNKLHPKFGDKTGEIQNLPESPSDPPSFIDLPRFPVKASGIEAFDMMTTCVVGFKSVSGRVMTEGLKRIFFGPAGK